MATKKLSDLSALAVLADADTFLASDASEALDIDKSKYVTAAVAKTYMSGALTTAMALIDGLAFTPQFRLSLTSGDPVDDNESSATTLYYTPYNGNAIQLYNGSNWEVFALSELSLTLTGTLTDRKIYDIFIDYNAGTPQMILGSAWTNDTTRANGISFQDGRLIKTGTAAYLYVGTIRAMELSGVKVYNNSQYRYLYNYYNKIPKILAYPSESYVAFILGVNDTVIFHYSVNFTNKIEDTLGSGTIEEELLVDTVKAGTSLKLIWSDDSVEYSTTLSATCLHGYIGKHIAGLFKTAGSSASMAESTGTGAVYLYLWM